MATIQELARRITGYDIDVKLVYDCGCEEVITRPIYRPNGETDFDVSKENIRISMQNQHTCPIIEVIE